MMKELFSIKDYETIREKVYKLKEFDIVKRQKGFTFEVRSSKTAVDSLYGKYEKGDYIATISWHLKDSGGGCPIFQYEFDDYFKDYETFCKHVNRFNPNKELKQVSFI